MALYVFAMQRKVGIDAEKIRPEFTSEEIAEHYFYEAERKELSELPAEICTTAFFLCGTRKDAYVKVHGDELQIPLSSLDVDSGGNLQRDWVHIRRLVRQLYFRE